MLPATSPLCAFKTITLLIMIIDLGLLITVLLLVTYFSRAWSFAASKFWGQNVVGTFLATRAGDSEARSSAPIDSPERRRAECIGFTSRLREFMSSTYQQVSLYYLSMPVIQNFILAVYVSLSKTSTGTITLSRTLFLPNKKSDPSIDPVERGKDSLTHDDVESERARTRSSRHAPDSASHFE